MIHQLIQPRRMLHGMDDGVGATSKLARYRSAARSDHLIGGCQEAIRVIPWNHLLEEQVAALVPVRPHFGRQGLRGC